MEARVRKDDRAQRTGPSPAMASTGFRTHRRHRSFPRHVGGNAQIPPQREANGPDSVERESQDDRIEKHARRDPKTNPARLLTSPESVKFCEKHMGMTLWRECVEIGENENENGNETGNANGNAP